MIDLALDGRVFINSIIDEALQELDMLFNTDNTELIGYPKYGTNFEMFLWDLDPSPNDIKKYIVEKLQNTFYVNKLDTYVHVDIMEGDLRKIYHVIITIKDPDTQESGARVYQLR